MGFTRGWRERGREVGVEKEVGKGVEKEMKKKKKICLDKRGQLPHSGKPTDWFVIVSFTSLSTLEQCSINAVILRDLGSGVVLVMRKKS